MERYREIHISNSHHAKADWGKEVNLSEEVSKYRQEFIHLMESFPTIRNRHFGRTSMANYRIKVAPVDTPVHSTSCRAGSKVPKFQRVDIVMMLAQKDIKPAPTEWAALKKDANLRFSVDYRSLNAVSKRDSYPIYSLFHHLRQQQVFKSTGPRLWQ